MRGWVNSVQTYCGLEITIMQTSPSTNWIQREPSAFAMMCVWNPESRIRLQDRFRDRRPVLSGIGRAVIDLGLDVAHHCLPAPDHVRELALQIDLVAAACQVVANARREPGFHHHVGPRKRQLHEPP